MKKKFFVVKPTTYKEGLKANYHLRYGIFGK